MNFVFPIRKWRRIGWFAFLLVAAANAFAGQAYPFDLIKQKEGAATKIIVQNNGYAPIAGTLSMDSSSNARSDAQWPLQFKLPPRTQMQLATIYPADLSKSVFFFISKAFVIGDPSSGIETAHQYHLPFKQGTVFDVLEDGNTYSGRHSSLYLKQGFDFAVPTGKAITSARDGVVIRVADSNLSAGREDHPLLGKNWDYDSTNSIAILHSDGSFGLYAHLHNDSAMVKEGDQVAVGQVIALAGKSDGPASNYVHFAVLRQTGQGFISIPIGFADEQGAVHFTKGDRVKVGDGQAATMVSGKAKTQAVLPQHNPSAITNQNFSSSVSPTAANHGVPTGLDMASLIFRGVPWRQLVVFLGFGFTCLILATWLRRASERHNRYVNRDNSISISRYRTSKNNEQDVDLSESVYQEEHTEPDHQTITKALLAEIEWKRFEEVVAAYFRRIGYQARTQEKGADGGIDIWLSCDDVLEGIVQCKHLSKPIEVGYMRELLGTKTARANRGLKLYFYSRSGFSNPAREEGLEGGVIMIDSPAFVAQVAELDTDSQKILADIATQGDYRTPTCASCGIKMCDRGSFWGCKNYPRCKSKIYKPKRGRDW